MIDKILPKDDCTRCKYLCIVFEPKENRQLLSLYISKKIIMRKVDLKYNKNP